MRGPMVSQLIKQLATQTNWGQLDALVVDFPPGTGDIQITLCQQLPLKGAVIVTTPQRLSFVDVVKGIEMFDELKVPTLAVVQNMAYFKCSGCNQVHYPFGQGYTEQLKSQFGIQNSFQLPIEAKVSKYSDEGTPFVTVLPDTLPIVKAYEEIAEGVLQEAKKIENIEEPSISYNPHTASVQIKTSNSSRVVGARDLRLGCKCALCVEELTGIKKIKEQNIPENVYPLNIIKKGNYAVAVVWSDGHNSSLYPYSRLLNQEEFRKK